MFWWLLLTALAVVLFAAWLARSRRKPGTRTGAGRPGGRTAPKPRAPRTRPAPARQVAARQSTARQAATTRPPRTAPGRAGTQPDTTDPQPGEIWWADVPYEDYSGHKVRPCVVIRVEDGYREVLKITSQDRSDRNDHVRIPTKTWDRDADHDSYLDLTGPVMVAVQKFDDRAGRLDPAIWRQVRKLYDL